MNLLDDLKEIMTRVAIPVSKQAQVVRELSKRRGGSWSYVGKKQGKI